MKLRLALIFFLLLVTTLVHAESKVLNLYMWTAYIPQNIIQEFQRETQIRVNVSEYDSNETMYAKLRAAPQAGYDIIMPSNYFLQRMVKQGLMQKLDKSKLPNFKYLNPALLNKEYDPNNQYSVPYLWGTTGMVVNADYFDPKSVNKWQDLWQPRFHNQLLMLDDVRDVFAVALMTLGYSVNDTNHEHIKAAYLKLKALLPNIKIFNSDIEQNIYVDEDAVVGMGYSGDIYLSQQVNRKVRYIYPQDGFVIWIDCLAIPKHARHLEAAHQFINFLLRPDIAKKISLEIGYSTPNLAAIQLLPQAMRDDPIFNPTPKTLARGQVETEVDAVLPLYTKYWEQLKIGS